MPSKGRKPKPTHLKLVNGNPGKRKLNANEPKPPASLPKPPAHLHAEAKAEWRRVSGGLYRLGLLSDIDRTALAGYCQAYARWVQAEKAITKMAKTDKLTGGLVIQTVNGNDRPNPLVAIANKAQSEMLKFAIEFGMTPSARSRISIDAERNPHKAKATYFD